MSSTFDFFKKTLRIATHMAMSVSGRDACRVDRSAVVTGPCIIGGMVTSCLLGRPTSYLRAHELWHALNKNQVTSMYRTVLHIVHVTLIRSSHTPSMCRAPRLWRHNTP
jgi:hypothetical protein